MSAPDLAAPSPPAGPPARAAANVFWLVAERGLKAVGGVVMGILIARHLGPDVYGQYGAAIGISVLVKEAVMLGFDRLVRRDLALRPVDSGRIIGTSVTVSLAVAALVITGLSLLSGGLIQDEQTRQLTLVVLWMALPQAFFACEVWFESNGQTRPLVWTRNMVWLFWLGVRIVLLVRGASVMAFALSALVEWIMTFAAVVLLLRRRHGRELRPRFDRRQFSAWLREGWPAIVMVAIGSTAERTMVLIVQTLAVDAEAGYLNAALRLTEVWWSIATIFAAVLLPRIVRLKHTETDRYAQATQLYADASLFLGIVAAIGVTLLAPILIPLLFGEAYRPSAYVLAVLFWGGPAVFSSIARTQLWVTQRQLSFDLPLVVSTAVVQLTAALLLIPRYGAMGAAAGMTAAQWISVYLVPLLIPPLRRASAPQYRALLHLLTPASTIRAVVQFGRGMIGRA